MIAYNAVGLYTKAVSKPVRVDITPPVLCCLTVGDGTKVDLMFITDNAFVIHWSVKDLETGIDSCQYAIGMFHSIPIGLVYLLCTRRFKTQLEKIMVHFIALY